MNGRMVVWSMLLLCSMAVVVTGAYADTLTSWTAKGWVHFTVGVDNLGYNQVSAKDLGTSGPACGVYIALSTGSIHKAVPPSDDWTVIQTGPREVYFLAPAGVSFSPLVEGMNMGEFMLKLAGNGSGTNLITLAKTKGYGGSWPHCLTPSGEADYYDRDWIVTNIK